MVIFVNGKEKIVEKQLTLNTLIKLIKIENQRVAIEINKEIIPRSVYAERVIFEFDNIEIITAVGGG